MISIEVPALRLGMAGYTEAEQQIAAAAAKAASGPRARWETGSFADTDAWWLEGRHTLLLPNRHLRVHPAVPTARSVQIAPAEVDRPVAFSLPITAPDFKPAITFALDDRQACARVLDRFTTWLQPLLARFALASSMAQHQPKLSQGSWEVLQGEELLAVVDLNLGTGVEPDVTPADFQHARWRLRSPGSIMIPTTFVRASVARLMWQYAERSERDLLPQHYRSVPLYFRRPPRLKQNQVRDSHLLLMRELAAQPGMSFGALQQSTGLGEVALARGLAALYMAGSITSNPNRASWTGSRPDAQRDSLPSQSSLFASVLDVSSPPQPMPRYMEVTAPLPLVRQ